MTAQLEWMPFCGAEYPSEKIAGDPIVCTREPHPETEKHYNDDVGWSWW